MQAPKTLANYHFNSELNELHKGSFKVENLCHKNNILPVNKIYKVNNDNTSHEKTIILPDLNSYVVFSKFLSGEIKIRFIGPRTKAIEIKRSNRLETLAIQFQPSGISFAKIPAIREMVNMAFPLHGLLGMEAEEQLKDMFTAWSNETKVNSKNTNFFFHQPNDTKGLNILINDAFKNHKILTVNQLSKQLGITDRYFRKLSYHMYGISPKTVLKVKRLHKSLGLMHGCQNFTQVALESGYYDQSHMISEYKLFIGKTPKQLFG